MEEQCGAGVFGELLTLGALLVGVEEETFGTVAFEKHDPDVGLAVGADGGQRHRVRIVELFCARLREPFVEQGEGVGHRFASSHARGGQVEVQPGIAAK